MARPKGCCLRMLIRLSENLCAELIRLGMHFRNLKGYQVSAWTEG